MSRIGKLPIAVPKNVKVELDGNNIKISGPGGSLSRQFADVVTISFDGQTILVTPVNKDDRFSRAMWGTARSIINSMIMGVTSGFQAELEMVGVGYRATIVDGFLRLFIGKSHPVRIFIPEYLKVSLPKPNMITIGGFDKEKLGQFVSVIMRQRRTEPYKARGIKFKDTVVLKKEGKRA